MTKQGAIKACMTSPDVCAADVNNFSIMEKERGKEEAACLIISEKMSNKGQQCKQSEAEGGKRRENMKLYV